MNLFNKQYFRDLLLFVFGFLGLVWFFTDIRHHWVPSTIDMQLSEERATQKADSIFLSWGYQPVNFVTRTSIHNLGSQADSLQRKYTTKGLMSRLREDHSGGLPLYRRVVRKYEDEEADRYMVSTEFTHEGELVSFRVSPRLVNLQEPFNRSLMAKSLNEDFVNLNRATMDTLISGLVDFQHDKQSSDNFRAMQKIFNDLAEENKIERDFEQYLGEENIWQGVDYYLSESYWHRFSFQRDSLVLTDESDFKIARAYLSSRDTVLGVVPRLTVDMLPAGSLLALTPALFNGDTQRSSKFGQIREILMMAGGLIFGVWILISFYLRIKARAVDTRPALIVAMLTGFLVSSLVVLELFAEGEINVENFFSSFFTLGLAGGFSAIAFFLMTAVSDSITRQYWPEKLSTWDLVRRGMFKNKPIGWAVVRGLAIGGLCAGLYVILLDLFPSAYLDAGFSFDTEGFLLGSVASLIMSFLLSLIVVLPVFMILSNQFYGIVKNKWVIPVTAAVCFAITAPLSIELYPVEYSVFFSLLMGLLLGILYLQFDFVTLSLGLFTFVSLLFTKKGWLIEGSPDASIFYLFSLFNIILLGVGIYFIFKGSEQDELPDYIPEYMEDLAKEQRVRQELAIARQVQKTFLPNTTPEVPGFDTSAMCDPALDTGGDYYDIICMDEHRAAVAIGDVSGKGIRAAFYMTFAKGVIHSLSTVLDSPKALISKANGLFNNNATRGTFISMIYGVLDSRDKTFTYVRAGHNPMLYKKANKEIEWPQPKGVAIGMTKGSTFETACEEVTVKLEKGDVLVLYTDGVTEAQNKEGEFYGEERLEQLLREEHTQSSKELRNLIANDVRSFVGESTQYDDMTLVVIKA